MNFSALIFTVLFAPPAGASHLSASRLPGIPASAYYPVQKDGAQRGTAYGQRVSLKELDTKKVPTVENYDVVRSKFESLRDKRFLQTPDSDFLRRITWLFPDDGCYARAEILSHLLESEQATPIAKIFVFGDLQAETRNSPNGFVTWWYHVAAAYRVENIVYIFDPAIEPRRPLQLNEWVNLISSAPDDVTVSVCANHTYEPESDCFEPQNRTDSALRVEQQKYLQKEWSRVEELGRNPAHELGDFPPWH